MLNVPVSPYTKQESGKTCFGHCHRIRHFAIPSHPVIVVGPYALDLMILEEGPRGLGKKEEQMSTGDGGRLGGLANQEERCELVIKYEFHS
jgi:hypothetical protein